MTMRHLLERRAAIAAELREINDAAGDNDLSAEQRGRFDALKGELDALEQRIARQAAVDDAERRAAGTPISTGDIHLDAEARAVGLLDAIRASLGATDHAAGRAREVSAELERRSGRKAQGIFWHMGGPAAEQRVVTTTTPAGGPGGNLIGTTIRGDLFTDRLRNRTRVRALGATVLTGLTSNITIPSLTKSVVAGWVNENEPLSFSDPEFGGKTLTPKHAGVVTELSRNMIQQSSPDVEQLVRNDMAKVLAETLDAAAIYGTGTAPQPRGILNTPGVAVLSIATNGGALTYDHVADLVGLVDDANGEGTGFLTNTRVVRAAAKLKDTAGNPLGVGAVFQGRRYEASNIVPGNLSKGTGNNLSALIYGNWSDLVISMWSELDILVNPYAQDAYLKGNVQIRAMMTVDIAVRHPESFAVAKDIAA